MLRIGAHMSVAGGVSKAVERAALHGCEALQIFTKNASRWVSPPLERAEVRRFRDLIDRSGIAPAVSHASYLINLATTDPVLRRMSIDAFGDELDRAHALGLLGVVIHPGTCTAGSLEDALRLIADAVRTAFQARPRRKTMVLFEHTAGQGRTVGHRFEHLAAIVAALDGSPRAGVCLDTCHLLAAGYDITTEEGYRDTFAEFDRLVGLDRLRAFHANDSKRPCGSRVDRHEHIGDGCVGLEPFRRLLHDRRFTGLPLLIETEKTTDGGRSKGPVLDPLDVRNLETLRRPARTRYAPTWSPMFIAPARGMAWMGGL
jgi:deoxyribonuclease IV